MSSFSRHWSFDRPLSSFAVNRRGDWMAFAFADGGLKLLRALDVQGEPKDVSLPLLSPALLAPDSDDHAFLLATENGHLFLVEPEIDAPTEIACEEGRKILAIAGGKTGIRAYAFQDELVLLTPAGDVLYRRGLSLAPRKLLFSPSGKRLALLCAEGAEATLFLLWVNAKKPQVEQISLDQGGEDLLWDPSSTRLLVASSQKSVFLPLPLPPVPLQASRSFAFDAGAKDLLGVSEQALLGWVFPPEGPADVRALPAAPAFVAPHPVEAFSAVATEQGAVFFVPHDGRREALILQPTGKPLQDLVWTPDGALLLAPLREGALLLFSPASIGGALREAG